MEESSQHLRDRLCQFLTSNTLNTSIDNLKEKLR